MFLFDGDGKGVYANDDSGSGTRQSTIPALLPLTPTQRGFYYLGISSYNNDPQSTNGAIFPQGTDGTVDPLTDFTVGAIGPGGGLPLSNWNSRGGGSGNYTITLRGTASPQLVFQPGGDGGNIDIQARSLTITDGASVSVSSFGIGNAGNIVAEADSIRLDRGELTATSTVGKGGNIQLRGRNLLLLRHNSLISAISGTDSNNGIDGNININTKFLIAVPSENSDIVANGFGRSPGSNIEVSAQGIFGTQFRQQLTPKSDIVATGQVRLNTVNVDPNRGLVTLPTNLVDISQRIDTSCNPNSRQRVSSFVVTGRGGISPNPYEPLMGDAVLAEWVTLPNEIGTRGGDLESRGQNTISPPNSPTQIVEASSWVVDKNGDIVLVATTPHSSTLTGATCSGS